MTGVGESRAQSRYEEDKLFGGHAEVWGSFYDKEAAPDGGGGKWGYACCRQTDRTKRFCRASGNAGADAAAEDDDSASEVEEEHTATTFAVTKARADCKSTEAWLVHSMKHMLHVWNEKLEGGDKALAASSSYGGKQGRIHFEATDKAMKPLFAALRFKKMDAAILTKLEEIFTLVDERDYRGANSKYIDLTIGNAPWPVGGVSIGGMSMKNGSWKVGSGAAENDSRKRNFMADETVKKYVQGIKRLCISFGEFVKPSPDAAKNTGVC